MELYGHLNGGQDAGNRALLGSVNRNQEHLLAQMLEMPVVPSVGQRQMQEGVVEESRIEKVVVYAEKLRTISPRCERKVEELEGSRVISEDDEGQVVVVDGGLVVRLSGN